MAQITLKRTVRIAEPALYLGYAMIVEVTNSVDVAEEIFVIQKGMAPAISQTISEPTDQFIKVVAPIDLQDIPPSPTATTLDNPYYRVRSIELWFSSEVERDDTWELIKEDVTGLLNFLNNHLDATFTEEITL